MQIGGFNVIILMDTKVTNQAYFQNRLSYDVVCSFVIITNSVRVSGGLGLVVQDQPEVRRVK